MAVNNPSKLRSNLVWLASFPRSGNTFLRILLNNNLGLSSFSIYNDPDDIGKFNEVAEIVGHQTLNLNLLDLQNEHWPIHRNTFAFLRNESKINLVKTHAAYHPDFLQDRVVYIYRDGRAALRSLVSYMQKFSKHLSTSQDILKQLILKGSPLAGYWGSHLQGWKTHPPERALFLKFEDVIATPITTIKRLSDFLNVPIKSEEVITFDKLHSICPNFFRKGKKKSWDDIFDHDSSMLFWVLNYQSMREYGRQHSNVCSQFLSDHKEINEKSFIMIFIKAIKEIHNIFGKLPRNPQCDIIESLSYILINRNETTEERSLLPSACYSLLSDFIPNLENLPRSSL
jgi:hypothetical protein